MLGRKQLVRWSVVKSAWLLSPSRESQSVRKWKARRSDRRKAGIKGEVEKTFSCPVTCNSMNDSFQIFRSEGKTKFVLINEFLIDCQMGIRRWSHFPGFEAAHKLFRRKKNFFHGTNLEVSQQDDEQKSFFPSSFFLQKCEIWLNGKKCRCCFLLNHAGDSFSDFFANLNFLYLVWTLFCKKNSRGRKKMHFSVWAEKFMEVLWQLLMARHCKH